MFRRSIVLATWVITAPLAAQATAVDPRAVQPERPTVATHAHTVAPGYVELETGIEGDRYEAGARSWSAPIVAKIGIASHVQVNLFTTAFSRTPTLAQDRGFGDVGLGVKWRLLDGHPLLGDVAILPALKLPTGSADHRTGTGTTDASVTLISSHSFGTVAMDLNAAYTRVGATGVTPASGAALWTASFGANVTERFAWVAELFGAPTIDGSGAPSSVELLTGPTYLVSPALNLDLGLITPIRGDHPNALYAGVTWNLGALPGLGR
jgi:hypothetical protein